MWEGRCAEQLIMRQRTHSRILNSARKQRRERMLQKLARARAAKERKRLARIAAGWEPEPKLVRWHPLELGVRDRLTGEVAWTELRSVRDAARRLAVVLREYQPGKTKW